MKSIITSTLALFLSVFVFAQNEITVSGTVANTDGTPVEGLEVLITSDSLTSGGFFSAVALTDANGDYSITVQLADADSQGWVYASIADCNQSFLYGSGTWSPGNSEIVIDFTYCDIQLSCYAYVFPDWENNVIAATMIGAPPFTYEWSNGETTESVLPDGSGLYCVTITDDLGCESSACYDASGNGPDSSCVVILVTTPTATGLEIEAMPYTIGTTTYLWSTGETTETIEVTDPGTYCVTATDSEGCVATACTEFFAEQCDVTIDINATGTMLIALPTGEAPFTYSWSTGSTLQESDIDPNVSFYSVVVTDAAGCVSTANFWYQGGGTDSCFVEIIPVQNGTMLEVIVSGATGSISYEWSTGETTPFLQDVQPGYYCVTVTSDNGCAETACILVEDPNAAFIIEGYVYLPDSINGGLMEGWAYLIVYDEEEGTLTAVDTTELQGMVFGGGAAYYQFDAQPAGEYLVKAALAPGSDGYEDHLPTYYGNVLWWNEASTITLPFNGWGGFNFTLTPGDNPGGPGFIGGYVADGANLLPGEIEVRDDEPMEGVSIILLDEQENPVAYTYTDANGEFFFPSLAYGTYKVVIEHIGYEQQYYWVTLSPENPGAEGLNFEIGDESITDTDNLEVSAEMTLFPNPASSTLQVVYSEAMGQGSVQIVNAQGQVVHSRERIELTNDNLSFDIQSLPAGMYYLQIATNGQLLTKKWMKQ